MSSQTRAIVLLEPQHLLIVHFIHVWDLHAGCCIVYHRNCLTAQKTTLQSNQLTEEATVWANGGSDCAEVCEGLAQ